MLKFEYIDTIRYEAGKPGALFLLADLNQMKEYPVAIFGTGLEAFFIGKYLEHQGMRIECFLNNDLKMEGRFLGGKPIQSPKQVWGQNFFIVAAMSNAKYLNEVLWQLKVHGEQNYAVALMETYHAFTEEGTLSQLQMLTMQIISRILCEGKSISQIIHPVINVGPFRNLVSAFDELCWSTTWIHHLMQWFYDKYRQTDAGCRITMLEIGPGKGLFSAMAHQISPSISIEWLMFDMREKSAKAVSGRYDWWPAKLFPSYFGMIEEPQYKIDKKFDIIVMTEVMEHFCVNPQVTLCKIADMLAENGELYLSTPDWGHLPIYDAYDDIPDFTSLEEYQDLYVGHAYQYTKSELLRILGECGLKVEKYALSDGGNHNLLIRHQ